MNEDSIEKIPCDNPQCDKEAVLTSRKLFFCIACASAWRLGRISKNKSMIILFRLTGTEQEKEILRIENSAKQDVIKVTADLISERREFKRKMAVELKSHPNKYFLMLMRHVAKKFKRLKSH